MQNQYKKINKHTDVMIVEDKLTFIFIVGSVLKQGFLKDCTKGIDINLKTRDLDVVIAEMLMLLNLQDIVLIIMELQNAMSN